MPTARKYSLNRLWTKLIRGSGYVDRRINRANSKIATTLFTSFGVTSEIGALFEVIHASFEAYFRLNEHLVCNPN